MTDYLNLDDLLATARAALGREAEVGDWGLLESALGRPRASAFGEDAYPDPHHKAAALLHSLATTQALVDGNKRLAWEATRLFYVMNDRDIRCIEDEAFNLVIAVATHEIDDVTKIAEQLHRWDAPL